MRRAESDEFILQRCLSQSMKGTSNVVFSNLRDSKDARVTFKGRDESAISRLVPCIIKRYKKYTYIYIFYVCSAFGEKHTSEKDALRWKIRDSIDKTMATRKEDALQLHINVNVDH